MKFSEKVLDWYEPRRNRALKNYRDRLETALKQVQNYLDCMAEHQELMRELNAQVADAAKDVETFDNKVWRAIKNRYATVQRSGFDQPWHTDQHHLRDQARKLRRRIASIEHRLTAV